MASVKIKFRPSTIDGQEGCIYYQVLHERTPRQLATLYKVLPDEWDARSGNVKIPNESNRKELLISIRERIMADMERLRLIARRLDDRGIAYTSDDIINDYRVYTAHISLTAYMEKSILRLKSAGRRSTSINYRNALSSFKKFLSTKGNNDILLDNITPELMELYQAHLQSKGIVRNTVSFYMRQLRAVYNTAVDDGLIPQRNPFRRVYTGIDKTLKRAISLEAMTRIACLDLGSAPRLDFARDMFVLSYYFRGMSFVDMSYLKNDNIVGGYIVYCRRKTGRRLKIKWTGEMQEIVKKYQPNATGYLLPIIKNPGVDDFYAYKNALSEVNKSLKNIGKMIKLPQKLTHYSARHTWASVAQAKRIPIDLISEGMGHDNVKTTMIYLASLDTSEIDKVNDKMIKFINRKS